MASSDPIAVIGMSCRFSGEASSLDSFWDMLVKGRSGHDRVPPSRYEPSAWHHPSHERKGAINHDSGFFLAEDPSLFDAPFFSITAKEAAGMDPAQRLLLEVAYETFENAGVPMETLPGSSTAVYSGCMTNDYELLSTRDILDMPHNAATGNGRTMLANRLSWFFDLRGPSVMMDTACSSSLTALHLAAQALRAGECKMALLTGASLILHPSFTQRLSYMHMLSADGASHSFDARANGYGRGEGIGAILLKPMAAAIADGDAIRAVIRATGINQDGRTPGITMPSREAQAALIRSVYESNRQPMNRTTYFEAHGTGTAIGDPTELSALGDTLGAARTLEDESLYVGSVKGNIGHTEGAAGVASLIKVVLCLEHAMLVPNAGLENVNPRIRLDEWRLRLCHDAIPWPAHLPQRASINSFGFGGSNAHAILESLSEFHAALNQNMAPKVVTAHRAQQLIVFSTHDKAGLDRMTEKWSTFVQSAIQKRQHLPMQDVAYTMCSRRSQLPFRTFAVADSAEGLQASLAQGLQRFPRARRKNQTNLALIFTGQGAQWAGMGRQLLSLPVFAQSISHTREILQAMGCPWDILEAMKGEGDNCRINEPDQSQTISCALQIALVDLFTSWGVFPRATIGHSSGEIGAAYAAGYLSHEDAIRAAYFRGHFAIRLSERDQRGGMLAAGMSAEDAQTYLDALPPQSVVVACVNSPSSITLSGDVDQIDILEKQLKGRGIFARRLRVNAAYHSPHMKSLAEDYRQSIQSIVPQDQHKGAITMISSVTNKEVHPTELNAAYWVRNMVSAVEFAGAVSKLASLVQSGKPRRRAAPVKWSAFVEMGPHYALKGPFHQTLQSTDASLAALPYCAPVLRQQDALQTALIVAGTLWSTGHAISLDAVNRSVEDSKRLIITTLPSYPWNHQSSFWHEPLESGRLRRRKEPRHDLLGSALDYQNDLEPQWRHFLRISENPWIADHVVAGSIVFPAAGMVTMAIEAARQLADPRKWIEGIEFQDLQFLRGVVVPPDDRGLETLLHIQPHAGLPGWYEFTLSSLPEDGSWTQHATGAFAIRYDEGQHQGDWREWEHLAKHFKETQDVAKTTEIDSVYDWLSQTGGVMLGPSFRSITQASFHPQPSRLWLAGTVTDTKRAMPYEHESPSLIHPTTLDSLFQAAVLSCSEALSNENANIPIGADQLYISTAFQPQIGENFVVHTQTSQKDGESRSQCVASDSSWSQPWISLQGVRLGRVPIAKSSSSSSSAGEESRFSSLVWAEHMESSHPKPPLLCIDDNAHGVQQMDLVEWVGRFCHTYGNGRALVVGDATGPWGASLHQFAPRSGHRPCLLEATMVVSTQDEDVEAIKAAAESTLPGSIVVPVPAPDQLDLDTLGSTYNLLLVAGLENAHHTVGSLLSLVETGGWLMYQVPTAGIDDALQMLRQNEDIELKYLAKNDSLIVARKKPEPSVFDTGIYVVVPEQQETSLRLLNHLEHVFTKFGVKLFPIRMDDAAQVAGKTVISLLELEDPWVVNWSEWNMQCFQNLLQAKYVIWISQSPLHGARPDAGFGATTGLLRTLRNERPGLTLAQLCLDGTADPATFELARKVLQVMKMTLRTNSSRPDMEYSLVDGRLLVPRALETLPVQEAVHTLTHGPQPKPSSLSTDARPLRLNLNLTDPSASYWEADDLLREPIQEGDVEVQLESVTLSVPTSGAEAAPEATVQGLEGVGTIVQRGSAVQAFVPGDKVVVMMTRWTSGLSTKVQVPQGAITKMPAQLSSQQAASLPFAYTIAYASLFGKAGLTAHSSVLIIGPVTRVLMACIHCAVAAGLQIYVAVSTDDDRNTVLERHPALKERVLPISAGLDTSVLRQTKGRGVDAAICSQAGYAGRVGARCLSAGGHYVNLSDELKLKALPESFVRRGCTFSSLDLSSMSHYTVEHLLAWLRRAIVLLGDACAFQDVSPYKTFTPSEIAHAIKHCRSSRTRCVLDLQDASEVLVVPPIPPRIVLPSQNSYILAGGLGTLGLTLARTLAECGARRLIFLSRSGNLQASQKDAIALLHNAGCQTTIVPCDISKKEDVAKLVSLADDEGWQIKGIVQCTTILRDAMFDRMTYTEWTQSTQSKIQGTLNLHHAFSDVALEFFITLSSVASVIGNIGQSNYAAGNAFMDALMEWRRIHGLAGCSINIGLVPDASGMGDVLETPDERRQRYIHLDGTEIMTHEIQALFRTVIRGNMSVPAQVIAGMTDTLSHTSANSSWQLDRKFDHRIQVAATEGNMSTTSTSAQLQSAESRTAAVGIMIEAIQEYLARAMASTADAIDPELPFSALGVDSLKATEVQSWVMRELGAELSTFEFLGSQSLKAVAEKTAAISSFVTASA